MRFTKKYLEKIIAEEIVKKINEGVKRAPEFDISRSQRQARQAELAEISDHIEILKKPGSPFGPERKENLNAVLNFLKTVGMLKKGADRDDIRTRIVNPAAADLVRYFKKAFRYLDPDEMMFVDDEKSEKMYKILEKVFGITLYDWHRKSDNLRPFMLEKIQKNFTTPGFWQGVLREFHYGEDRPTKVFAKAAGAPWDGGYVLIKGENWPKIIRVAIMDRIDRLVKTYALSLRKDSKKTPDASKQAAGQEKIEKTRSDAESGMVDMEAMRQKFLRAKRIQPRAIRKISSSGMKTWADVKRYMIDTGIPEFKGLSRDGVYDRGTFDAIYKFQVRAFPGQEKEHDGIVGGRTWTKMNSLMPRED